jgi:hypothetical protein
MSEAALERARVRARVKRRQRKPPGIRPPWTWWTHAVWTGCAMLTYAREAIEHRPVWTALAGLVALGNFGLMHWALIWWRWERQEGLPHQRADRIDQALVAAAIIFTLSNILWLAGVR